MAQTVHKEDNRRWVRFTVAKTWFEQDKQEKTKKEQTSFVKLALSEGLSEDKSSVTSADDERGSFQWTYLLSLHPTGLDYDIGSILQSALEPIAVFCWKSLFLKLHTNFG